jgi:riboflavin kinase/FMN adenylyltransferase
MSGFTVSSTVDAVAIGNFDGMHRGHQTLFDQLGDNGGIVVIEHYRSTLTPHIYRSYFTELPIFFYDFDLIREMRPEKFVEKLQRNFPNLRRIVVGEDFLFGLNRSGNVEHLKHLFEGEVIAIKEVTLDDQPIHSRFIRKMIEAGDMEQANEMLGRPYEIWGDVIRGQGIGKEKLVPTINLKSERFLLPKAGVYATETAIDGCYFPSVSFVGHRQTTDGAFAIETHLIDQTLSTVKGKVSIRWYRYLRENRKFDSLDALKAQIAKDIEVAHEKR